MNLVEKQKLRRLRKQFTEAPHYIRNTRWFTFTKVLLDKLGDPGPEPEEPKDPEPKTFTAPEGCTLPELADGGEFCKDCQTPVEGCVTMAPDLDDPEDEEKVATAD